MGWNDLFYIRAFLSCVPSADTTAFHRGTYQEDSLPQNTHEKKSRCHKTFTILTVTPNKLAPNTIIERITALYFVTFNKESL